MGEGGSPALIAKVDPGFATGRAPGATVGSHAASQPIDAEVRGRAVSLDHFGPPLRSRHERSLDRRLAWGFIVGALALVTIVIVIVIASTAPTSMPTVEAPHVAPPAPAVVEPHAVPLPALGAVDIRGPSGAEVFIRGTSYGVAPVRIELAPGEYSVVIQPPGRRHRAVTRAARVVAGRTTPVN